MHKLSTLKSTVLSKDLLTLFMSYLLYTFPMKPHKCVTCMTQFLPLHYPTVMGISWWSHLVLFQSLKWGHRLSKYSQNCQLLVTQKHAGSGVLSSRRWRRGCLIHTDLHCLSPLCSCHVTWPRSVLFGLLTPNAMTEVLEEGEVKLE